VNLLLDTMALVRAQQGTLPRRVVQRLQRADRIFVSIVTPWELALKRIPRLTNSVVGEMIDKLRAELLAITLRHTGILGELPDFPEYRDPFDRMIIAQALEERCPVVTLDHRFTLYKKSGLAVVWE
jgi:PIN domain nuclease of toxin-antitoxin system